MTTITEDYVSFETAQLLRYKGFDEGCHSFYDYAQRLQFIESVIYDSELSEEDNECVAPTLQMAMKWLREEKGIAVVPILSSVLDNEKFLWDIEIVVAKTNETYHQGWIYEFQERACEVAIKYCLENLI